MKRKEREIEGMKESIQTNKAQTKQRKKAKKEQLQTHQDYSIELSAFRMIFKRNFM